MLVLTQKPVNVQFNKRTERSILEEKLMLDLMKLLTSLEPFAIYVYIYVYNFDYNSKFCLPIYLNGKTATGLGFCIRLSSHTVYRCFKMESMGLKGLSGKSHFL